MMRCTLGLITTCAAALCLFTVADARADDLDMMQGTWKAVSAARAGEVASPAALKNIKVIVSGREFTLVEPGTNETITITLYEGKRPHKWIDFGKKSFVGTGKGKRRTDVTVYQGIYKFEGPNRLELSWGPLGQGRPQNFNARRVKDHRLLVLEK
jgi:uncharacterized protein (TIGR03067 family)